RMIGVSIGLRIGLVVNARRRASARRSNVLVFAVAAGVTLASFVNVAWIMPMGNQACRVGAAGHPASRGLNELTLGELAALLEPGAPEPGVLPAPARRLNIATAYHARWALTWSALVLAVFVVGLGRWARRRIVLVLAGVAV